MLLLGIFLLAFYLFDPTFNLALFGDDWLAIWNYQAVRAAGNITPIEHFFTLYGPQEMLMWGLAKTFGYEGTLYYLLSFLMRMLAAFSLYPLTHFFTKNKLASFFATLFLATTFVGLEATNWVFNMNVYFALALLNFSLYFFLKNKNLFSLALFFIAHIIAPSRVFFFIFVILILDIIQYRKFNFKKHLPFWLTFIFARSVGNYGVGRYSASIIQNLISGKYNLIFLKQSFITLGSLVIPETYLTNKQMGILGILLLVSFLFFFYQKWLDNEPGLITAAFLLLMTGLAAPLVLWPNLQYVGSHRHMLPTTPGLALLAGFLVNEAAKKKVKFFAVIPLTLVVVLHIYAVDKYLLFQSNNRSQTIERVIWDGLQKIMPNPRANPQPLIFYFESDVQSTTILSDLVYFGFPAKTGVLYGIDQPENLPTPTLRFETLPEILEKGRYLGGDTYQEIPLENIYGFRLEEKSKVIDITKETRLKLSEL